MKTLCRALLFGVVFLAAVLPAWAQPKELVVALRFTPQGSSREALVALPPSMLDRSVEIQLVDWRNLTDASSLGEGTDDDDRPFAIRASTDVVGFVTDTVTALAGTRGLKTAAPADRQIRLRLTRFAVNESNKAVGSTYSAEVHLAYTVTDAEGNELAEGAAAGVANRYGRARSGANCSEVLSDALKEAFMGTLGDPKLQAAWTSVTSSAPPTSAAGKETMEERLRRVDDLLKKGLITPEEHKLLRAQILKES
jgi:hypothetical protein